MVGRTLPERGAHNMTVDYEAARQAVSEGIRTAGKPVKLRIFTEGGTTSYDPETGEGASVYVDYTDVYIVTPRAMNSKTVSASQGFDIQEDGFDEKGILFAKMEAVGFPEGDLSTGDLLKVDGACWRISGITPVKPALVTLVYNLGLKKVTVPDDF